MQKRLDLLGSPQQLKGEDAEDSKILKESHAEEVFAVTQAHDNLIKMQLALWRDHGIAAKGTRGDGNCGIEMLLSFAENMPVIEGAGEAADRGDLLEIQTAYRKELKRLWESVCGESFWQDLWHRLVGSRANMDQWKALLEPEPASAPGTPIQPQNKRSKEAAETPEKTFAPGKLLAIGEGEPSLDEVTVDAGEPARKRPKPSGKPKALSEVITFENYHPQRMAEGTQEEWPPFVVPWQFQVGEGHVAASSKGFAGHTITLKGILCSFTSSSSYIIYIIIFLIKGWGRC